MSKKLIAACMAIAAFAAIVLPAAASASPVLTQEGKPVAVGTSITGQNTGETIFTGAFNVRCANADLSGTVTENSGTSIKGEIPVGNASFTGTGTGGDCTSALGSTKVTVNSKLCLQTTKTADQFEVTGCGAAVTFTLEITGTGPCKYSTAAVLGEYTTAPADAKVTVSEQEAKKEEGGFFCPSSGKLDMVFDLTSGGKALQVS